MYVKQLLKFFEYFEDINKENIPLFLEIDEENNIIKKRMTIYQKPKNQITKDEVWKGLWRSFINNFLSSETLQKVIYKDYYHFSLFYLYIM